MRACNYPRNHTWNHTSLGQQCLHSWSLYGSLNSPPSRPAVCFNVLKGSRIAAFTFDSLSWQCLSRIKCSQISVALHPHRSPVSWVVTNDYCLLSEFHGTIAPKKLFRR